MSSAPIPGFPNDPQTDYARIPKGLLPGDVWEGELFNERAFGGLLAYQTVVALVATISIGANTPADQVGVFVDGGAVPVVAGANATATAALLGPALIAAGFTDALLVSAIPGGVDVVVTGVLGKAPTLVEYSPATTTATVVVNTPAVTQPQVCYGFGVAKDSPSTTINNNKIKQPTTLTDVLAGVLVRTHGTDIPREQVIAYDEALNPDFLVPGQTYATERENIGVVVEFVGALPTEADNVFWICTGNNAGKWAATNGGTSQITRGDVEFNGAEVVGLAVDALPDLTVLSNTSDDQTAADLRDAWNASAQHAAVAAATIDTSGAESFIDLAFVGTAAHTVVAVSPATADVVGIVNTATAVPANAKQIPEYSWGQPSISAGDDAPARAFLRLSNP